MIYGIELTATELGLISSAVAAIVGAGGWLLQRRKVGSEISHDTADASAITVKAALSLIEPLQSQLAELRTQLAEVVDKADTLQARVDELESREKENSIEIRHLREGVDVLTSQVLELGKTPRWPPPASGRSYPLGGGSGP